MAGTDPEGPAGICNRFSHTTLTTASGKGLCASRGTVPEGTTERKHPIPTHLTSITPPAAYKYHEQERQQCCKGSLSISPTLLQGPSQEALHSLVLLQWSSVAFLGLLLLGPKLHHSWAVRTSLSLLAGKLKQRGNCVWRALNSPEMRQQVSSRNEPDTVGQHGSSSSHQQLVAPRHQTSTEIRCF